MFSRANVQKNTVPVDTNRLHRKNMEDAIEFANNNAEEVVQQKGVSTIHETEEAK